MTVAGRTAGGRGRRALAPAAVAAGYLVGSIPVAGVVGRRRGVDLRAVGDRNPGWWNARATWGARGAAPVLAGDVAKGVVAGLLGRAAASRLRASGHRNGGPRRATSVGGVDRWWLLGYAVVGAAMVGHAWPAFAGFRGGRSVLTWVGGTVVLAPRPAAAALATCAATGLARRDGALGARVGVAALPALQLLVEGARRTAASGALMSLIGLRFALAGRSGRATSAPGAARPG